MANRKNSEIDYRGYKTSSIKLLQVIDANSIGGAQKIAFDISNNLRDINAKSFFLVINKLELNHKTRILLEKRGELCYELNLLNIRKLRSFRIVRVLEQIYLSFYLIKAVIRFKINLVHFHINQLFYLFPLMNVLCILHIPFVWTLHGDMDYPPERRIKLLRLLKNLKQKKLRFLITQISPEINYQLCNELSNIGISTMVIPNGIDLEEFTFSEKARESIRDFLEIAKQVTLIGSVGRIEEEKGFDLLIQAFNVLPDKDNKKLIIIGEGSLRNKLIHVIDTNQLSDKVFLPGAKDNIQDWLSAFDLYVQPSRGEGFGLAILEAMSIGLPIIASNVGGIPNLLDHGKAGLLVAPDSVEELADSINFLLSDYEYREKLSINARRRAQKFSSSKMVMSYVKLYKSLILN